jgi:FkbH-like protein
MEMEIMEVGAARERTLELIQKTNQFNLTTRRYNWDELCAAIRPGFGLCYRLKDRFGDNGVISVILVALEPQDGARIDLWLMSCRVLGRHVEEAILSDVAARAKALGARKLLAEYLPTTKNKLVQDLYPRLGFEMVEKQLERDLYERDLSVPVEGNNLIRIVERIAGAS